MTFSTFDTIKVYVNHPSLIVTSIKDWFTTLKINTIKSIKRKIYEYERNTYYDVHINNYDYDYYLLDPNMKRSVLNPVIAVTHELELYYDKHYGYGIERLGIGGIYVDTQYDMNDDDTKKEITVTIILKRPGLLIGKAGSTMDELSKKLGKVFGRPVTIKINEWKNDVNEPVYIY